MAHIEAMEGRTLFAASVPEALIQFAEASNSPAVQATLDLVKADLAAINESRAGADTRAALQQIIDTGSAQLATARDAVRDAADPATRDAAIATLKATRLELKSTLASARANLRNSSVENREELRAATTSLRQHLKELRQDIRYAIANPVSSSEGLEAVVRSGFASNSLTLPAWMTTATASTYRPSGSGTLNIASVNDGPPRLSIMPPDHVITVNLSRRPITPPAD